MVDILVDFGVPIIASLITYLVAVKEQNIKLKETRLKLQQEIETLEKSHKLKLEELEKEMEIQNKSKQNNMILDVVGSVLEDPEKLENILTVADRLKDY